jgi:hypothetical protein
MKKTYIIPELEVILEETSQQLLAASVLPKLSGSTYGGETILAPGMDSEDLLDF